MNGWTAGECDSLSDAACGLASDADEQVESPTIKASYVNAGDSDLIPSLPYDPDTKSRPETEPEGNPEIVTGQTAD